MNKELLQQALAGAVALAQEAYAHWCEDRDAKVGKILSALSGSNVKYDKRADVIHQVLAQPVLTTPSQPEKSEPVAWYDREIDCAYATAELNVGATEGLEPLYLHPVDQPKP